MVAGLIAAILFFIISTGCSTFPIPASSVSATNAPDGTKISYEVAGRGEPTLVFVHGWSCDRSYWDAQMKHFSDKHQVVAIDLGGHGDSGLSRENWTMESFADDVVAVVESLDLQNVVLIGHSMGGTVVVQAAQHIPQRTAAVIPVDSFTSITPEVEATAALAMLRSDFSAATENIVQNFMFAPGSDPGLAGRIARDMAAAPPDVALSAIENYLEQADSFPDLKQPVRLINADLAPTDLARWRQQNPDVQLAVMPDAGHFLMIEEPDEFNRLLARAIRELAGQPNPM